MSIYKPSEFHTASGKEMNKLNGDLKAQFREYVQAAEGAKDDLDFLLDNLGVDLELSCTAECFESLEKLFWSIDSGEVELPEVLYSKADFIALLCRYLGQCLVENTSGEWVQSTEKNRRFGQPCVDGFGNESWDRFYPVALAKNFRELPTTKPSFPGARERRILRRQFEKAMEIYAKSS